MKITKRQLRRIIKEEKFSLIKENFDIAKDELSQAKSTILKQDKYFSNLAAAADQRGDDWLFKEIMSLVRQLRQASDFLDQAKSNIDTVKNNSN